MENQVTICCLNTFCLAKNTTCKCCFYSFPFVVLYKVSSASMTTGHWFMMITASLHSSVDGGSACVCVNRTTQSFPSLCCQGDGALDQPVNTYEDVGVWDWKGVALVKRAYSSYPNALAERLQMFLAVVWSWCHRIPLISTKKSSYVRKNRRKCLSLSLKTMAWLTSLSTLKYRQKRRTAIDIRCMQALTGAHCYTV